MDGPWPRPQQIPRAERAAAGRARRPRRDAEANRERVQAAAASAMMRDGHHVPLATIAAEADVGVGTLYRKNPDRNALLQALEYAPTACSLRSSTRSAAET